jgi:hypothetical protein
LVGRAAYTYRVPLIYDHASAPREGYEFRDHSGVKLKADSLRLLEDKIADFRSTNGFPPGNPAAELEVIYRATNPHLVTKVGTTPVVAEDPVARWVSRLWRLPPKEKDFAESETVRVRLETCVGCPHYVAEHAYDAGTARRLAILSHARMTDFAACEAHKWSVGMASLMQSPDTQVDVEGCWARPLREKSSR